MIDRPAVSLRTGRAAGGDWGGPPRLAPRRRPPPHPTTALVHTALGSSMYPLNVTLIGCQDTVQRNVLSMLINQQANLDGQYADADAAVTALRDDISGPRLFIM